MRNNVRVSANFLLKEFESPDTGEVVLDDKLIILLQRFRDKVGKPVTVTSGYRTPEHNREIGGALHSPHMQGIAADIVVDGMTSAQMASVATDVGFTGVGIYPKRGHCHVDVRQTPATWTENN